VEEDGARATSGIGGQGGFLVPWGGLPSPHDAPRRLGCLRTSTQRWNIKVGGNAKVSGNPGQSQGDEEEDSRIDFSNP